MGYNQALFSAISLMGKQEGVKCDSRNPQPCLDLYFDCGSWKIKNFIKKLVYSNPEIGLDWSCFYFHFFHELYLPDMNNATIILRHGNSWPDKKLKF